MLVLKIRNLFIIFYMLSIVGFTVLYLIFKKVDFLSSNS